MIKIIHPISEYFHIIIMFKILIESSSTTGKIVRTVSYDVKKNVQLTEY
jgi:hypothetical protein